jgi:DNA-binding transcriptional ArsR family regulator
MVAAGGEVTEAMEVSAGVDGGRVGRGDAVRGLGQRGGRPAPEHADPASVPLTLALAALSDPVRLAIVRELAGAPEWSLTCGSFDVPVGKAARSHHFTILRQAGVIEQRDDGPHRRNRLRREEFDGAFPGLLDLILTRQGPV